MQSSTNMISSAYTLKDLICDPKRPLYKAALRHNNIYISIECYTTEKCQILKNGAWLWNSANADSSSNPYLSLHILHIFAMTTDFLAEHKLHITGECLGKSKMDSIRNVWQNQNKEVIACGVISFVQAIIVCSNYNHLFERIIPTCFHQV